MSTKSQLKTQDKIELVVGAVLLLSGAYKLTRIGYYNFKLMYGYYKYLKIDTRKTNKIGELVANPSLK